MDLKIIHDTIDQLLRKSQGGYLSPEEKDMAINWGQNERLEELKPAYNSMQAIDDALLPFKKKQVFTNGTSAGGTITLNQDYLHLLSVETVVTDADGTHYITAEKVGEDELADRKSSALIPLNAYNPICTLESGNKVQLYPAVASAGTVYYLRKPKEVKFDYEINPSNGREVQYNPDPPTQQLEWNEPATQQIIQKAVAYLAQILQVAPPQTNGGGN